MFCPAHMKGRATRVRTPGLKSASGRSSDFTSLLAEYAIRTLGGVGGPPREGRSYPVRGPSF